MDDQSCSNQGCQVSALEMTSGFNRSPRVSFTTSEGRMEESKDKTDSSPYDGYLVVIYVFSGVVGFLILALIIIAILVKRRRAKENMKETEEMNNMYGRDYYHDTQIVDKNDYYYRKQ